MSCVTQRLATVQHHSLDIPPSGDLRKLAAPDIQRLPLVANASRLILASRSPMLLNPICRQLFPEWNSQGATIAESVHGRTKLSNKHPRWSNVIDPFNTVCVHICAMCGVRVKISMDYVFSGVGAGRFPIMNSYFGL